MTLLVLFSRRLAGVLKRERPETGVEKGGSAVYYTAVFVVFYGPRSWTLTKRGPYSVEESSNSRERHVAGPPYSLEEASDGVLEAIKENPEKPFLALW